MKHGKEQTKNSEEQSSLQENQNSVQIGPSSSAKNQEGSCNGNYRTGHCMDGLSPTYNSWRGAKERCTSPNHKNYELYKGRWYEPWNSFKVFLNDMGERPENTTLDRIDNDLGYHPDNCRWATHAEQHRNHSRNVLIDGETAKDWAEARGLNPSTVQQHMKQGFCSLKKHGYFMRIFYMRDWTTELVMDSDRPDY